MYVTKRTNDAFTLNNGIKKNFITYGACGKRSSIYTSMPGASIAEVESKTDFRLRVSMLQSKDNEGDELDSTAPAFSPLTA